MAVELASGPAGCTAACCEWKPTREPPRGKAQLPNAVATDASTVLTCRRPSVPVSLRRIPPLSLITSLPWMSHFVK